MVLRLAALAAFVAAGAVQAQIPRRTSPVGSIAIADTAAGQRGWFGFRTDPNDDTMIVEVAVGSPAELAGLRAGDRIIAMDGFDQTVRLVPMRPSTIGARSAPDSSAAVRLSTRRPVVRAPVIGRQYDMTLRRGEETFTATLLAVAPPEGQELLLAPTRAPGSPGDTLVAAADSFRTELVRAMQPSRRPTRSTVPARRDTLVMAHTDSGTIPTVVDAEAYARLQALLERIEHLESQSQTRGDTAMRTRDTHAATRVPLRATRPTLDLRANAVAGAEFEELNPALGAYFGGSTSGVFVLRVAQGSPATTAGLEPGDIVQSVNGQAIATVSALRETIASEPGPITLRIVRKGKPATVTLRKE